MSMLNLVQKFISKNGLKQLDTKISIQNFETLYLKSKRWFSAPFFVLIRSEVVSIRNIMEETEKAIKNVEMLPVNNMSFVILFDVEPSETTLTTPGYWFNDKSLSFIHIVYHQGNKLYWDKDFYYHGDKDIKGLVAYVDGNLR